MPKRNGHVPSYRLREPSGLARVIVNGEYGYLGPYGSAESHEKYARLIAEMSANRDSPSAAPTSGNGQPAISINEMLAVAGVARLRVEAAKTEVLRLRLRR